MADISNQDKAAMTAKASGPVTFTSLSDQLNEQYNQAFQKSTDQQAAIPQATQNTQSIGDFTQRAPGEAPVGIAQGGQTLAGSIAKTIAGGRQNVLDVLSSMMNLKKQQDAVTQQAFDNDLALKKFESDLMKNNMIIDKTTGQPRGMTPDEYTSEAMFAADPVLWLKSQPGGLKIAKGEKTVSGLKSTAEAIKLAGSVEEYLKTNPGALYTAAEQTALDAKKDLMLVAQEALGRFDESGQAPGVGKFAGILPNWKPIIGEKGQLQRANLASITNEKIRQISGAAVSDQEAKRLMDELPNKTDDDSLIKAKLERFVTAINVGEKMKLRSTVDGISLDEAYKKYGTQAYTEAGQPVPEWLQKEAQKSTTGTQSGRFKVEKVED